MSYSLNLNIDIPIKYSLCGYRTASSRLLDWLVLVSTHSLSNAFQSYFDQLHREDISFHLNTVRTFFLLKNFNYKLVKSSNTVNPVDAIESCFNPIV